MTYEAIRLALRDVRKARRVSTAELAGRLGVCRGLIVQYENGRRIPPSTRLIDWAAALGFNLSLAISALTERPKS